MYFPSFGKKISSAMLFSIYPNGLVYMGIYFTNLFTILKSFCFTLYLNEFTEWSLASSTV